MDISGPNALNKSMQGLWARKTRVNLNATPPPGSAAAAALLAQSQPQSPSTPVPKDQSSTTIDESPIAPELSEPPTATSAPIPSTSTSAPVSASNATPNTAPATTSGEPSASNSKRKSRTTADGGSASKRHKSSSDGLNRGSGSSSSKDKDYSPPTARLSDLGGVQTCVEKILELVAMPIAHPEVYIHTGVQPPRGVLLHGPPGCGKTLLANAIAGEVGVPFISISAPSIVSGMSGESEKTLREAFDEAAKHAPAILFIDEIDAITPKRESAQREMERRIVAQFLTCMDELSWEKTDNKPVIVIGATNRPDSLDSALRRAGRFDHEIAMTVPDEVGREQILRVHSARLKLSGDFNFKALAKATPGYVGADLGALTGAAGVIAVKRIFRELAEKPLAFVAAAAAPRQEERAQVMEVEGENDDAMLVDEDSAGSQLAQPPLPSAIDGPPSSSTALQPSDITKPLPLGTISSFLATHPSPLTPNELAPLTITYADFLTALTQVQPSSKREGFATIPDVTWRDIGALRNIREELQMAIVQPIRRPEIFKRVGVSSSVGVLMWGPPGCGKTLLAKAVARESRANFISVKGPELLNKYVGESERAVRQVFMRAQSSSPCVVFFDELDALVPRRDDSLSEASARVVNTLLTELDGLSTRKEVYVIAATNRPDMIDPAMCRPGRLDKLLYVDLPDAEGRADIVKTVLRKVPLGGEKEQTLNAILDVVRSAQCDGYSGADLAALVREAGVLALRETLQSLDALESGEDDPFKLDTTATSASSEPTSSGPAPQSRETRDQSQIEEDAVVHVELRHVLTALDKVVPSVSSAQRRKYEALRSKFAGLPVRGSTGVAAAGVGETGKADEAVAA
ncbi:AAA-domain-containing protein [Clavulina sp. PMI_390]|nr:AAA-domain-containing protein [Clavulina sp. PMI_390]